MSTITLTASMRSNLSSLKTIQKQMDTTQERLSTGKKVNSAIDNASSYYQARALTNRASDLDSLLDSMGQGIQTIQSANEGLEALTSYVEQMKAVANTASTVTKEADDADGAKYKAAIKTYVDQFNAIRDQAKKLIDDASYQGVNLLKGDTLKVVFNEGRTSELEVKGTNIADKVSVLKDEAAWAEASDITDAIDSITTAMTSLRSISSEMGNNYSIIQTRQDFTEALIDVLETGADDLVLADMNEESANYLALQTRQQLAINSLSLASQSAQSVLQLF